MVPDILVNGEQFYFPVFTTAEEMGEYGKSFSKVQKHFLEAVNLARNNEKKVVGIVINVIVTWFRLGIRVISRIAVRVVVTQFRRRISIIGQISVSVVVTWFRLN